MSKWYAVFCLMRFDKLIGFFLLLWPTLWALWLSNQRAPDFYILIMFIIGVFSMRSLGCVVNDYIDKDIDCYVRRTKTRPLFCGLIGVIEVLVCFFVLLVISCVLLVMLSFRVQTILLSLITLILTCIYPYTKRCISFPQIFLGVTFSFSILIVFSVLDISLCNILPWLLFLVNIVWTIIYDTEYAMVDRDDDILFGIRSSAVFLSCYDKIFIGVFQIIMLQLLIAIGLVIRLGMYFYVMLIGVVILFIWQQVLIKDRDGNKCFQAFLSNNYVGMLIFFGIFLDLLFLYDV